MKKYRIGLLAIIFAVTGLAFTKTDTTSKSFADCDTKLIWYKVWGGHGDTPASINGTFDVTKLDDSYETVYPNLGSESPPVVNATDFPADTRMKTRDQFLASEVGCELSAEFVCAIGFKVDATPDGEFEIFAGNVGPKSGGNNQSIPLIKCIVYRDTK